MLIFIFYLMLGGVYGIFDECQKINECSCALTNGIVIDLTPLGSKDSNRPRFQYYNATNANDNHLYSYNPCFDLVDGGPGKDPNESCSLGVAVCQVTRDKSEFHNLGFQEGNSFQWNSYRNVIHIIYVGGSRQTNITLECSSSTDLEVKGEKETNLYEMTLRTPYACLNMSQDAKWFSEDQSFLNSNGTSSDSGGLSTGSILVIIFFVTIGVYFFGGMAYLKFARGAVGKEMIPDYEFWLDFPLLVRDGAVFVFGGCRSVTIYEQI